jgi:hypothetical protein
MSSRPELRLDWATHDAARHAVTKWHYSRRMPAGKLLKIGAWEGGRFIGVVIYGCGATPEIAKPYKLSQMQVCELVRVALRNHRCQTSKVVAISLRMLRASNPGLRLVVSFADSSQGHHGGIYQASGWIYTGSEEYHAYRVLGIMYHPRSLYAKFGVGGQSIPWLRANVDPRAERVRNGVKHKYVMPLDAEMRARILPLAKPYPKRAGSADSGTPGIQPGGGGATPTPALDGGDA